MTEEEAKTKWCPMTADERYARTHLSQNCIGSACMVWQQTRPAESITFHPAGRKELPAQGRCGMAGRP